MKGLLLGFDLHVTHTGVKGKALMVYAVYKNPYYFLLYKNPHQHYKPQKTSHHSVGLSSHARIQVLQVTHVMSECAIKLPLAC